MSENKNSTYKIRGKTEALCLNIGHWSKVLIRLKLIVFMKNLFFLRKRACTASGSLVVFRQEASEYWSRVRKICKILDLKINLRNSGCIQAGGI